MPQHGFTMVFSRGNRGIFAPVPGAPHSPPSSPTLVSARLFLSHILPSLLCLQLLSHSNFFPFIIPEVLPPSWMGPALASSRSLLALAVSDTQEISATLSQNHTHSLPSYQNLAMQAPVLLLYHLEPSLVQLFQFLQHLLTAQVLQPLDHFGGLPQSSLQLISVWTVLLVSTQAGYQPHTALKACLST